MSVYRYMAPPPVPNQFQPEDEELPSAILKSSCREEVIKTSGVLSECLVMLRELPESRQKKLIALKIQEALIRLSDDE